MVLALTHLLAAYVVLAAPWLARSWYQRARRRIASGIPHAKLRLYRGLVVEQIASTVAVLGLWRIAQLPASSLGVVAPRSWGWTALVLIVIAVALVWSSLLLRPRAEKIRHKVQDSVGALIPDSRQERSWWGVVSVGAGVSEELVFRGFLLYYLSTYLPQMNTPERVLLASLVFGMGHIYQGWKGALGAGILGLILAAFYLMTGSLLLPVLVHAAVDARVLLIFPPRMPQAAAAEETA